MADSSTSPTTTLPPRTASSTTTTSTTTTHTTASFPKSTTTKDLSSQENSQERPFLTNGNWIDQVGHDHKGKTGGVKELPPTKKAEKPPVTDKKPKAKGTDNDIEANLTTKTEEHSSEMSGSGSLVPYAPFLNHSQSSVLMVLVPIALGIVWLVLMAIFAVVICCRRRR